MAKRFLRSIVQDQVNIAAAGDIAPLDLPVNPLSFLVLTIWVEKIAWLAVSTGIVLSQCFDAIGEVSVRHRGENIIQGRLRDLCMMAAALTGYIPHVANASGAAARTAVSFLLPFSRMPYWHEEAFPATSRGNLRFFMTVTDVSPGIGTATDFALEACELIEDTPSRFLKYTTLTRTPAATGRQRVPLPIGNDLLKILLFDPETEISGAEAFAWGKVKIMKDNVEQYYAESNAESLRFDLGRAIPSVRLGFGHAHGSAGGAEVSGQEVLNLETPPNQYHLLDFDPLNDGSYALDSRGASQLDIDVNVDSIAAAAAMRYIPVELVQVSGK
jgi:hypothetical protein